MFHYGNHSNHLPRISRWAGEQWVVAGDDVMYWLSPTRFALPRTAHLGPGVTTAMAASASGTAVVGRYAFGSFDTPAEAARGAGGSARLRQISDPVGGQTRGEEACRLVAAWR